MLLLAELETVLMLSLVRLESPDVVIGQIRNNSDVVIGQTGNSGCFD